MPELRVEPVLGRDDRDAFIRLPSRLYRGQPGFVPPLLMERREILDPKRNAYFEHARARYWLARRGERVVGRVSAQVDRLTQEHVAAGTGHFGLLDAEDDQDVFDALLAAAEGWLREGGMTRALGPFSLSINESCGLLVDGFDAPAMLLTDHAPPYAGAHVEAAGYAKAKDLVAYLYDPRRPPPFDAGRLLRRLDAEDRIRLRPVDIRRAAELRPLIDLFNDAWSGNWGFVPFTPAEAARTAANLRPIAHPRLAWLAELDGRPACMAVALPNLNEAIADLDGRLLPFGWARLLWRLKVTGLTSCRVPLMGLRRDLHRTPVGAAVLMMLLETLRAEMAGQGYARAELSWVLEDNAPLRTLLEGAGARVYKTYRVYGRDLADGGPA